MLCSMRPPLPEMPMVAHAREAEPPASHQISVEQRNITINAERDGER